MTDYLNYAKMIKNCVQPTTNFSNKKAGETCPNITMYQERHKITSL